jgi:telomere length regulation protein
MLPIIWSSSNKHPEKMPSVAYLLTKLANVGVFPPSSTTSPAQPCFWKSTLPIIRHRLKLKDDDSYSSFFSDVIQSIPSSLTQQTILGSLLSSLNEFPSSLGPSPSQRGIVKREAALLRNIVGCLNPQSQELWENVSAVILNREWDEGRGRIFVCWTAGANADAVDTSGENSSFTDVTSRLRSLPYAFVFQLLKFFSPKSSMSGLLQTTLNTP